MPILNYSAGGKTQAGGVIPAPDLLANIGPVIPVTLTLPDNAQRAYIGRGQQPPAPISGTAMIDTGATATCFDTNAAQRAGLPTVGVARMASASHANHPVPTFAGKIICSTITINVEINVAPSMGANLSAVSNGLIALLGRDVLKSAILTYNGPDGHFSLAM